MKYVMSDIHGNYEKYEKIMEKLDLKQEDTLYILGDVIDRGDDGIKILRDMMRRSNVVPILGNHELMAYAVLKRLNVEITEENYDTQMDFQTMQLWQNWMFNGGDPTQKAFTALPHGARKYVLEYLSEFSLYETVRAGENEFVLVHGGLKDFSPDKPLDTYDLHDLVWERCDYKKVYYEDKFLVTGHTPTVLIDKAYSGKIYRKHNHIAIDCGASVGLRLGCICLDTLEEFYV